ncbi:hypothetical protein [Xanthomonas vasicola]|uniref:hypothetical protein n=1 Tax=Xanthomonas vasicola TaxID=56459 RepID=UPI0001CC05B1|nr:hypothetical protein [Xanthomonas vasicola]KFA39138.1 hypothetical protein KWS_0105265 [Xanthomonas vasicola pv. musacearum NCPPB 4384]AZR32389.1 hypothetical protein KWO_019710 [Xanthomonas vasicola pv. musacearum NCPPB 4379]KFA13050.1 hypothetical protein KWM_0102100 [Xanthomonas vasicola pv. musacearum NCPPB 2005]KFA16140.1 hypothetical protein KWQ_0100110 [Xanthomonas vasicola pv. musacearum NCPPB 4380]KFA16325.1 hypothetical protein A11G_0119165 [Xanthomonas vasicola pv. musacearum NCP
MRLPHTLLSSLFAVSLPLLPLSARAQSGWINQQGEAIADSPSRKMVQGLGASLLLTSDADRAAKWNTPSDTTPHFSEVDHVSAGDSLFPLMFISNPGLDAQQRADVVCSIRVIEPTEHAEQNAVDAPCLQGSISGNPRNVFLAHVGMTARAEASAPPGRWQVQVTFTDRHRSISIPPSTTYTQGRQRRRAKAR